MDGPQDHDGERLNNRLVKAIAFSADGWPTAARAFLIGLYQIFATHSAQEHKEKCPRLQAAGIFFADEN